MTGWLISCDILSASSRPTKSPPPPAAPGTTMVTGCVGKSCAATGAAARPANTIAADTYFHCALLIVVSSINLRSEEHTSELQSLMRNSYAVFCLKQNKHTYTIN